MWDSAADRVGRAPYEWIANDVNSPRLAYPTQRCGTRGNVPSRKFCDPQTPFVSSFLREKLTLLQITTEILFDQTYADFFGKKVGPSRCFFLISYFDSIFSKKDQDDIYFPEIRSLGPTY